MVEEKNMKKIIVVSLVAGVGMTWVIPTTVFAMKIGYADMELALASTKAGKKAKSEIEKEVTKRKKNLEKSRAEIVKLEEDFKKQELVMSEQSKEKKKNEYLKKVEDLRNMVSANQQEMQDVEQKIATPILKKMSEVLQKLSRDQGYDVVVAKGALLYADPTNDLTEALVEAFDKAYKGK